MFNLDLEKAEEPTDQIANICCIIKKAREFPENIYSALLTTPKPLTVWITTNCGKFLLKEMGIPDHLAAFLRNLYAGQEATVRTGHGTGSILGKKYVKAVYIVTLLI